MWAVISNTAQIKQKYVTIVLDQRQTINGKKNAKQLLIPTDVNKVNPYSWDPSHLFFSNNEMHDIKLSWNRIY
jgi:hypothetical protein